MFARCQWLSLGVCGKKMPNPKSLGHCMWTIDALLPLHKGRRSSQHTRDVDVGSETEKNRYANVLSLLFAICILGIHVPFSAFSQSTFKSKQKIAKTIRAFRMILFHTILGYLSVVWLPSQSKKESESLFDKKTFQEQIHTILLGEWELWPKFRSIKAMRPRGSLFHCLCAQLKLLKVQVA